MYVGVGATKFDELVVDGRMPQPGQIDGRKIWDIRQIDLAFEQLFDHDGSTRSTWDDA